VSVSGCFRVKHGDVPVMADVLDEIDTVQREIETRLTDGRTPLPAEPDWATISAWSVNAHRQHWSWGVDRATSGMSGWLIKSHAGTRLPRGAPVYTLYISSKEVHDEDGHRP
jgi:hypothetical protein